MNFHHSVDSWEYFLKRVNMSLGDIMFVFQLPQRLPTFCGFFVFCFLFIPNIAHSNSKTILYHPGGGITSVYIDVIRIENEDTQVRIEGKCMSACTLYLVSDRVCISRAASFKFHQAQIGSGPRSNSLPNIKGSLFLMQQYPPRLRNWINKQGGLPWHGWLTLNARNAVKHGIATFCDEKRELVHRKT